MSAFGRTGFGSLGRRSQLRAQGQLDPYGQQVRAAMRGPMAGDSGSQGQRPTQNPPPATQQQLTLPAKSPNANSISAPQRAQPVQPQSQGTPYGMEQSPIFGGPPSAQQLSSAPAGLQRRDWEGNTTRNMLSRGLSADMAANVLAANSTRYAGDQATAKTFASQAAQIPVNSIASGPPQAPGPNATASEVSAYFDASEAYGRQRQAQQARDEQMAAEAAFNDPARTAGGPSQSYIDTVRRQQMNQGGSALMNPFAYRSQLQSGAIDVFGNAATGSTPSWAMYNYQAKG